MNETARQLLARIEAIDSAATDNRLRAEAYQRMNDELKETQGRATSPDGAVTVVAGPGGGITSIAFSESSSETAREVLAADVLRAISEAQANVARAQADVVRRGLGDTELLDRVLDSDEALFGASRPSSVSAVPAPAAVPSGRPMPAFAGRGPRVADEEFEQVDIFDDGDERRR
ncbi:YbaB/EbfC family nucleoid-associated protein [Amycolatopsis orientalis]|uniref:YbaB/EbfC family nucleoid-associated protein n=1 Tax=Amycolatopsis orientalis TaxID=31958 RepID=UPI0003A487C9|nr:YbaB/EbfC family nucleoid-associated protein [Amycolatopsis orientalis]